MPTATPMATPITTPTSTSTATASPTPTPQPTAEPSPTMIPGSEFDDMYLQMANNMLDEQNIDYLNLVRGTEESEFFVEGVIYIELDIDEVSSSEPPHAEAIAEIHREMVAHGESGEGLVVLSLSEGCLHTYSIEQHWTEAVNSGDITDEEYLERIFDGYQIDCS